MTFTRTVAPTLLPLSLAEVKAQARIVHDQSNDVLLAYLKTATQDAEDTLGRGLLTQTWELTLPHVADVIWLPYAAPLQSVSSVKYYDVNGVLQTLSTSLYTVDTSSLPGRIVRAPNASWPSVQADRLDWSVKITYVVGWTAPELIPETIRQGIRIYVTYLDANRDGFTAAADQARAAAYTCWEKSAIETLPPECSA